MAQSPVQVVLNADNFVAARETQQGGGAKDFFVGRDEEFKEHRDRVFRQLEHAATALSDQRYGGVGYAKVTLQRAAMAKSHRPLTSIFRPDVTPLVGSEGVGELIVEVTPETLAAVGKSVETAELTVRMGPDSKTGEDVPKPTRRRSEVGAIEQIDLWAAPDKRNFAVSVAVEWLADPRTGGAYRVELFVRPRPRGDWDDLPRRHRQMFESFEQGLRELGGSVVVHRLETGSPSRVTLVVRLAEGSDEPLIQLTPAPLARHEAPVGKIDLSVARHTKLLEFLDGHPLVRSVELPPRLEASTAMSSSGPSVLSSIPHPVVGKHPKVGVIDGGIGSALDPWVVHRWGLLDDSHRDERHGTFIAGMLVAGQSLNPDGAVLEPDGCQLFDVDIFPEAGVFAQYYDQGVSQFFDELEAAVAHYRDKYNVRVFNLSINATLNADTDRYSVEASRLDAIADKYDVVIVISAGNLSAADFRPEWSTDANQVLAGIATSRNDIVLVPAESVRNLAVTALNPPGHGSCIAHAPASYSRRGPGLRAGVKPDLSHVGGARAQDPTRGSGLASCLPDGSHCTDRGTSFAAPQIAKTLARLDHIIEGNVSRETLIALLVHHATVPQPVRDKAFKLVARDLVGFGMPPTADELLSCADHEITLVFASRLYQGKDLVFPFTWPASLVTPKGSCRGEVNLTLVATPPLDPSHRAEFVRVNLDAFLRQEHVAGFKNHIDPAYLPGSAEGHVGEAELIEHALKWSPVKRYAKRMPRGVGESSNWKLQVEYLTRAGELLPKEGVPFTVILTIRDPDHSSPIFNEARQSLLALGVRTADIQTAARIVPRV